MLGVVAVGWALLTVGCAAAGGPGPCRFEGPFTIGSSLWQGYLANGVAYQGCDRGKRAQMAVIQTMDEESCTLVACSGASCFELGCAPGDPVTNCTATDIQSYEPPQPPPPDEIPGVPLVVLTRDEPTSAFCEYTWTLTQSE
jgi:hypothetical protein